MSFVSPRSSMFCYRNDSTTVFLSFCSCPYWAVPVFVTLCLSVLGCACLCYAVPIFIGLCLSLLGCACLCYAVPNRVQLCWPLRAPLLFRNRILTLDSPLYSRPRRPKYHIGNSGYIGEFRYISKF